MDDSSTRDENSAASNASEFRLVYCPKCRKLLTEFAHIPLYRCGRCDTVLQAKNFRSGPLGMLNHSTSSSPVTMEENSSALLSLSSEDCGAALDSKCLNNQSKTDTSHSERVATNFDSNIGKAHSILDNEDQCSGTNKHQGNKEHWNGRTTLSNLETFDGNEDALGLSSCNVKHDEAGGDEATEEKTTSEENCAHGGSVSSSEFSSSKYEKGEITFMDNTANRPSTLPQTGFAASRPFDGRKIVDDSSFDLKPSDTSDEQQSVQDRMKFESDSSFEGLSTNTESAILDGDRMQILRQIDKLRDQLLRARVPDRRDCLRVGDRARHLPQIDPFTREHSLSMLQHPVSLFETGNHMACTYRESQVASMLSWHTLGHLHSMSKNHCPACGSCRLSPSCCSEIYRSYCHMCSHPPRSTGTHYHTQQKAICRHNAGRHKLEVRDQNGKVGNRSAKCHCRPVLGGSCFISCYRCLQLLQIPDDFHFSMRSHGKLRCGACFQVLTFSVYEKTRIVPYCFAVGQLLPGEIGNDDDATEHSTPSPHRYFTQGGWFLFPAENGMSPTISYSTEVENRQYGERSEIQPPLHSLMGYISASEILYDN